MPIVTVPVSDDWTADVEAMAAAVDDRTVLVVGSAPQYPQGVVDPIAAIAELAASVGAWCHVDACMGGFVLPFAEMLGRETPPWDFRVDGVHSISADIHKLGYAPKGVSVIVHRTKELRRFQTWTFDGWLGGFYGSPNLQGTRSGAPMAAAWAVMQHLGLDGYVTLTRQALETADRMRAAVDATDGIRVVGDPRFHVFAMTSDPESANPVDVFALGDALARRGLVPRPPGTAGLAALDGQRRQRQGSGGVGEGSRGSGCRGARRPRPKIARPAIRRSTEVCSHRRASREDEASKEELA